MSELIWLIPLIPFIGFVINGLMGNRVPKAVTATVGCGVVLASFVLRLLVYFEVAAARETGASGEIYVHLFDWFTVGKLQVALSFLADPLSAIMLLIITGVGFLIHLYSCSYMAGDTGFGKFF